MLKYSFKKNCYFYIDISLLRQNIIYHRGRFPYGCSQFFLRHTMTEEDVF